MVKDESVVYDTIIVGAGVCGMRAGQYLKSGKGGNILVIEARDRVGGRVNPICTGRLDNITPMGECSLPPIVIEAGANWIHDLSSSNPIRRLAKSLQLEIVSMYNDEYEFDPDMVVGDRSYYKLHGKPRVFEREEFLECEKAYKALISHLGAVYSKLCRGKAVVKHATTLKNAMISAFSRLESKQPMSDSVRQLLSFGLEGEATSNAADLDTLGFSSWYNSPDEGENGEALVKGGVSQILPTLRDGLDVRLKCCVKKVEWGGTEPIRLAVENEGEGHPCNEVLSAWNVIVTVPMGCLKHNSICFTPSLPEDKTSAIATIGVGLLDLVVLRFKNAFWPCDKKVFGVTPSEEFSWSGLAAESAEGCDYPLDELFSTFLPLSHVREDDSHLLMAYVYGRRAVQLEQMSEEDVATAAVLSLRMIFGDDVVTSPVGCVLHKWGQDPLSRGSYCATMPGTTASIMSAMAIPLCSPHPSSSSSSSSSSCCCSTSAVATTRHSCLQFAGEGTDYACIGLLQGAYNSGTRAAMHITKCHIQK